MRHIPGLYLRPTARYHTIRPSSPISGISATGEAVLSEYLRMLLQNCIGCRYHGGRDVTKTSSVESVPCMEAKCANTSHSLIASEKWTVFPLSDETPNSISSLVTDMWRRPLNIKIAIRFSLSSPLRSVSAVPYQGKMLRWLVELEFSGYYVPVITVCISHQTVFIPALQNAYGLLPVSHPSADLLGLTI